MIRTGIPCKFLQILYYVGLDCFEVPYLVYNSKSRRRIHKRYATMLPMWLNMSLSFFLVL